MIALLLSITLAGGSPPQAECLTLPVAPKPGAEAAGASWYINNEPLKFLGKTYTKYGLPRVIAPGTLKKFANFGGVILANEIEKPSANMLYVLTNYSRCEFQPYMAAK